MIKAITLSSVSMLAMVAFFLGAPFYVAFPVQVIALTGAILFWMFGE
jgi:Na+/H+ antiporter NhaD/arsenite permease-like protein